MINEFYSFRRLVITLFITIVLGDLILGGKIGVVNFICLSFFTYDNNNCKVSLP